MKVYESTIVNKRGFVKVPQLKIKNSNLEKSGFNIGCEYKIIYEHGRIILQLNDDNNSREYNYESGQKE